MVIMLVAHQKNKKIKKNLFISPKSKEKIDDIHHFQQSQINLQREMYYEQRINSSRLSFIESVALKFCGKDSTRNVETPQPSNSGWNPWYPSPQRPPYSPNSWDRQPKWSLIKPFDEHNQLTLSKEKSPKNSDSPKSQK